MAAGTEPDPVPVPAASLALQIKMALTGLAVQPPNVVVALHRAGRDYLFPFPSGTSREAVFGIGSVTKVFTATLLASRCLAHAMRLGDPVTDYLPSAVTNPALQGVTLRMLATHTSAFPRMGGRQPAENLFADEPPAPALLDFWNQWTPAQPPGACWCYSNVGFVTLGYAVSGTNVPPTAYEYLTLLEEVITGPGADQLNMPVTTTYAQQPEHSAVILGHATDGHPVTAPAPDLYSSGPDMLTWLKANLAAPAGSSPLDRALVLAHQDQQVTRHLCPDCPPSGQTQIAFSMALAWQISQKAPQIWAKDGAAAGYSCWIGVMPSAGMGLAILTNQEGADPGKVGAPLMRALARL